LELSLSHFMNTHKAKVTKLVLWIKVLFQIILVVVIKVKWETRDVDFLDFVDLLICCCSSLGQTHRSIIIYFRFSFEISKSPVCLTSLNGFDPISKLGSSLGVSSANWRNSLSHLSWLPELQEYSRRLGTEHICIWESLQLSLTKKTQGEEITTTNLKNFSVY